MAAEKNTHELINEIPDKLKNEILNLYISEKIKNHPLPWRTESDWGTNILDTANKEVFHCIGGDTAEFLVDFSKKFHIQGIIEGNELIDELRLPEEKKPVPVYPE